MKRTLLPLVAATLVALAAPSYADDNASNTSAGTPAPAAGAAVPSPSPAKMKGTMGKVTAVTDTSFTVTNKKTGDQTFKTDASTKFAKTDKSPATMADVTVGAIVRVKPGASPDLAARVVIGQPKAKTPAAAPDAAPAAAPAASASATP